MTTISDPQTIQHFLLGSSLPDTEMVLVIETEAKIPKKSPLYERGIRKLSTVKVVVNFNYAERAKAHDPNWQPKEKAEDESRGTWGKRLGLTCLVEHKGELYLHCWQLESQGYTYFDRNSEVVDKALVHEELGERKPGMPVRRYKLSNIRRVEVP